MMDGVKATFWSRTFAFVIDLLLSNYLIVLVGAFVELSNDLKYSLVLLTYYTYNVFGDHLLGVTLGKRLLRIRVINRNGQLPSWWEAISRNFGKVVSALPLYWGFLRILAPHRSQTIHDELSNCYVVTD